MPKRRIESSSSSSSDGEDFNSDSSQSSIKDPSITLGSRGAHLPNGSRIKTRNGSAVSDQGGSNPVASTSNQLQREMGNIVKDETVELIEVTDSPPQRMAAASSSSANGHQSQTQPEVRRSTRERVSSKKCIPENPRQRPPSKKNERFFEGCLVMGEVDGPFLAGMIRKAKPGEDEHHAYVCNHDRKTWYFIQFFTNRTTLEWRLRKDLRVFNADVEPETLDAPDPDLVENYATGIKIATAASNYSSVKERLKKFTLRNGAPTDNLLKEIEEENGQPEPRDHTVAQEPALPQGNVQSNSHDSVVLGEDEPVPPTRGNGQSSPDSVDIDVMTKQVSDYHQKLREECSREKDKEIKSLKTVKSNLAEEKNKLEATVEEQAKVIAELRENQRKESLEHKTAVEKEKQEKLRYKKEFEKMKVVYDQMIGEGGAQQ